MVGSRERPDLQRMQRQVPQRYYPRQVLRGTNGRNYQYWKSCWSFYGIILNALSQEALAHYINRKKDDAVAFFLFNLIHFHKLTLYKAECYMVAIETVTVFENDGEVVGELILEAGKKMKWKKHEWCK